MSWTVAAFVVVPVILVAGYTRSRAGYYRRIFATEHLEEIHRELVARLDGSTPTTPITERPTAAEAERLSIRTSAGVVLVVSHTKPEPEDPAVLHVSISQIEGPTTRAVAERIGFLVAATLAENKLELSPFCTPSRVYHLAMKHSGSTLRLRSFDAVLDDLHHRYQPIPFQFQEVGASEA